MLNDCQKPAHEMIITLTGAVAVVNSAFGPGNGPVLLHNVMCSGFEYRLLDCLNGGIELNSCGHSQDAGVRCPRGITKATLYYR